MCSEPPPILISPPSANSFLQHKEFYCKTKKIDIPLVLLDDRCSLCSNVLTLRSSKKEGDLVIKISHYIIKLICLRICW
ncbi:hypothetical protein Y032_0344g3081 [Ancylostoma ceylanicum]|uniref:Uncharacterized protein n=1 Tax=Ancylostoma ceylanicum TaxID=53326 RepID=A0A016RYL7_9BILA|nr:hypothetical protein Y032_0344g3081 [Ancylostoma ceylanicum]